jgi:23S rRNA (cytidine1920-2'-O)/16S rRNA (cytidine1409-2'-O)-methyltransferase
MGQARIRLDQLLVERGHFPSRARAQGAIEAGLVTVGGRAIIKPSHAVDPYTDVIVLGDVHDYVSRGGVKLAAALDAFSINPEGSVCLDLGASTGGFTDVLLRRRAARVYAVDVGHGQLHSAIAADPRVQNLEGVHAKDISRTMVPEQIGLLVADVSFISLRKALPPVLDLLAREAALVLLVKPQFEVGRENIGKGGIVKNAATGARVAEDIASWLRGDYRFQPIGVIESPIKGGDGNSEFLIGATRTA